jgi:hypothetical protein
VSPSPAGEGVGDEGWITTTPASVLKNRDLLNLIAMDSRNIVEIIFPIASGRLVAALFDRLL